MQSAKIAGGLLLLLALFACATVNVTDDSLYVINEQCVKAQDSLAKHIEERIKLMIDVAVWKWHHDMPIEDKGREERILHDVRVRARGLALDEDVAIQFFKDQINKAKQLQQQLFEEWSNFETVPAETIDLMTVIRPRLDALTGFLLQDLVDLQGCN